MTRVKICGLTDLEDALIAAQVGADLLGFVFYPPSPRYVGTARAREIIDVVRRTDPAVQFVGVFVNEAPATVRHVAGRCGLDYVQLHGAEPPEMVEALIEQGIRVIKAFRIREGIGLPDIACYSATAYLLDTYASDRPGGTGRVFNWRVAIPAKAYGPVLLSGGLNPDNVAEALRMVQPWGVDVCSGVEDRPGRKDPHELCRFLAVTKGIDKQRDHAS